MLSLNAPTGRAAAAIVLCGFLLAPVCAAAYEPAVEDELLVTPGQDDLLAQMLGRGASLPGGCRFTGGGADGPVIASTYKCSNGRVMFEIFHPAQAPPTLIQTEQFAIAVRSGSPPARLVEAVAYLIHSREADFQWHWKIGAGSADVAGDAGDAE